MHLMPTLVNSTHDWGTYAFHPSDIFERWISLGLGKFRNSNRTPDHLTPHHTMRYIDDCLPHSRLIVDRMFKKVRFAWFNAAPTPISLGIKCVRLSNRVHGQIGVLVAERVRINKQHMAIMIPWYRGEECSADCYFLRCLNPRMSIWWMRTASWWEPQESMIATGVAGVAIRLPCVGWQIRHENKQSIAACVRISYIASTPDAR
jgi:hypothetical protein